MSTVDNSDEANRQSSQWLDSDDENASAGECEIPADQQACIADLQFTDALLSSLAGRVLEEKEARIQSVMKEICADEPLVAPKAHAIRLKPVIALAASLLIACGLFWMQFARESRAEAILREIGEVALENIDRIYDVRREASASNAEPRVEGKLYLRGCQGFLLRWGDVVLGRDGDRYWLVPASGRVVLADDFEWIVAESGQQAGELEMLKLMSSSSRRVPIMQVSAAVELMKEGYEIALNREQHDGRPVDVIVGTLRENAPKMPDRIIIWADVDSRIIQRFSFHWASVETIVFELTPSEDVPANWYKHETHHDNQRGVRRIKETATSA